MLGEAMGFHSLEANLSSLSAAPCGILRVDREEARHYFRGAALERVPSRWPGGDPE